MPARIGLTFFNRNGAIRFARCLALLALFACGASAWAQEDPPARVGRVSDVSGSVYLAPDEADANWQPIGINYPVTAGDSVWVSQDGRAEIDFGSGQVRLSDEANAHFSQLDDRQFSAYLASGHAILRLRALDPGESAKLDTPNAQIDIVRTGSYRIEVTQDGLYTRLVVRDGEALLRIAERTATILGGQTAIVDGSGSSTSLVVRDGHGTDAFDAWSAGRDRRVDAGGQSARYVSDYIPGVNDLDSYGTWDTVPAYGAVWYPRTVAADWVPYRDGRWTFVRPWGWTWVDGEPWGWVPFHYGRWVRVGVRWGWCPGTYVARPIYAPALVAWYGGAEGTSWSVSLGGPTLGWVPLSWGEPYWPQHRYGTEYWRQINRPHSVNVYNVPPRPLQSFNFANARIPGAVTAVSTEVFTGRRPIGSNRYALPQAALNGAALTITPIAVRPPAWRGGAELPRGMPAPASVVVSRGTSPRPDFRAPAPIEGRSSGTRPGEGTGRPAFNPPVVGGQPTITDPRAPTGRPAVVTSTSPILRPPPPEPAPGTLRPIPHDIVPATPEARPNSGQSPLPSTRPGPGGRQPIGEQGTGAGRPSLREPAPYNPGLNVSPQPMYPAPARPPAPTVREPVAPQQYNSAPGPAPTYAPPPRPAAPMAREQPPTAPQYNPGLSPAPSYVPPPRPAPPVMRETAPQPAPPAAIAPMPGPGQGQQGQGRGPAAQMPGNLPPALRPIEPQQQPAPPPGNPR